MTRDEWMDEGRELFGPDLMSWRFVCPVCGHIQTAEDYKAAGAPGTAVAFSCVGRWLPKQKRAFGDGPKKKGPCDYAGGGLFKLNPVEVEGVGHFDFDRSEEVQSD